MTRDRSSHERERARLSCRQGQPRAGNLRWVVMTQQERMLAAVMRGTGKQSQGNALAIGLSDCRAVGMNTGMAGRVGRAGAGTQDRKQVTGTTGIREGQPSHIIHVYCLAAEKGAGTGSLACFLLLLLRECLFSLIFLPSSSFQDTRTPNHHHFFFLICSFIFFWWIDNDWTSESWGGLFSRLLNHTRTSSSR